MGIRSEAKPRLAFAVVMPVCLLGACVLFGLPAAAQQALTTDQVRACLCEDQAMAVLRQRVDAAKARFNGLTQRENAMSVQIDQLQSSLTQGNLSGQDQLRELIDMRTRISQERRIALPDWQIAAHNLDMVVQDYNARCASHPMYQYDIDQAKQNLVCPAVP